MVAPHSSKIQFVQAQCHQTLIICTTVLDDPERAGRNGKKSLLPYLDRYKPLDLVILALGTNDLKSYFNRTSDQIADGLKDLGRMVLMSQTASNGKSPLLLLVAPPPIKSRGEYANLFEGAEEKSHLMAKKIQVVADDLHCQHLDAGMVIQSSAVDGIHWDGDAHRAMGIVIAERVRTLLN